MKRLPRRFGKIAGFSLVELMISITVGLIVVAGIISIFSSTIKSYTDNLRMTRLNQELRVAMNLMVRDIRRAGYRGDANVALIAPSDQNPYASTQLPLNQDNLTITGTDCITFSYDKNSNYSSAIPLPPNKTASVEPDDRSGFRLFKGVIQWRHGGSVRSPGCPGSANWNSITDGSTVTITSLGFSFTPDPPQRIQVATGIFRIIRGVTITLTGELTNDPTIERTITETVRVQNDTFDFP